MKQVISIMKKGPLLFNLIPIAFNKELEGKVQIANLLIETRNSINIIRDFFLISFRFYGEPDDIHKCFFPEYKDWIRVLPKTLLCR